MATPEPPRLHRPLLGQWRHAPLRHDRRSDPPAAPDPGSCRRSSPRSAPTPSGCRSKAVPALLPADARRRWAEMQQSRRLHRHHPAQDRDPAAARRASRKRAQASGSVNLVKRDTDGTVVRRHRRRRWASCRGWRRGPSRARRQRLAGRAWAASAARSPRRSARPASAACWSASSTTRAPRPRSTGCRASIPTCRWRASITPPKGIHYAINATPLGLRPDDPLPFDPMTLDHRRPGRRGHHEPGRDAAAAARPHARPAHPSRPPHARPSGAALSRLVRHRQPRASTSCGWCARFLEGVRHGRWQGTDGTGDRRDRRRRPGGGQAARQARAGACWCMAAIATRGETLVREIEQAGGKATFLQADLSSLAEVRRLADAVKKTTDQPRVADQQRRHRHDRRNAPGRQVSADGHELRFAVNYLAGFLLTHLLLPLLKASAPSRIVNVSSAGQQAIDFDDVMLTGRYSGATRLSPEQAGADPVHRRPGRRAEGQRRDRQLRSIPRPT